MKLSKCDQTTCLEKKAMSKLLGRGQDPCYEGCGWCTPQEGESGSPSLAMRRALSADRASSAYPEL